MTSENAAPEWPDDVVAKAEAAFLKAMDATCDTDPLGAMRAALAAIAPHVAAREKAARKQGHDETAGWVVETLVQNTGMAKRIHRHRRIIARLLAMRHGLRAREAAQWIAGRDAAAGACAARHKGLEHIREYAEAQWCSKEIAALTPPATSALDAHVAARVAEAVAKAVPPGHVVVPRMDEGERNRVIGLAEICEADSTRSHFGADLADDIAQTLRKLADALYPAAKEPGHE